MATVIDKSYSNRGVDPHYNRASTYIRRGKITSVDRSMTVTTTSQQLMAANSNRQNFFIKNDSAVDVYIRYGTDPASATIGGGNIKIAANGGYLEGTDQRAIQIIAASATAAVTAGEGS